MGDKDVIMMRGHGITSVGRSVEGAGLNAILINELAEMNYKAALLGTPRAIPDEDLESFRKQMESAGPGPGDGGVAWETYRRMVDD